MDAPIFFKRWLYKKMINSKNKGARGERMWRDELRSHGYTESYRSQQYCGTEDSADVICPELPNYHFEVKFTERFKIYDAMWQARHDSGQSLKIPIVAHKKKNHEWLVVMCADDFFNLIKE